MGLPEPPGSELQFVSNLSKASRKGRLSRQVRWRCKRQSGDFYVPNRNGKSHLRYFVQRNVEKNLT